MDRIFFMQCLPSLLRCYCILLFFNSNIGYVGRDLRGFMYLNLVLIKRVLCSSCYKIKLFYIYD